MLQSAEECHDGVGVISFEEVLVAALDAVEFIGVFVMFGDGCAVGSVSRCARIEW